MPHRFNMLASGRRGGLVILLLSLGLLLGLAACARGSSGTTGTISGDVVAGPTCPVQQQGSSCQPKPVTDRKVTIETTSGSAAATATTDSNGHFSVNVAPGSYVVKVQPTVGGRQVTPGNVTVTAGHTTTIHIVMDTGIR